MYSIARDFLSPKSGEGVAVDKIRKCGRYIAYTALVALH